MRFVNKYDFSQSSCKWGGGGGGEMWVVCNGINTSEEVTGREIRPCKRIKNSETKGMDNSETEEA